MIMAMRFRGYVRYSMMLVCMMICLSFTHSVSAALQSSNEKDQSPVKREDVWKEVSIDSLIVKSFNRFAYEFLRASIRSTEESNVVVSPVSMEMQLSLLINGMEKHAQEEVLSYLHMSSLENLNEINSELMKLGVTPFETTQFSLSNSLWVAKDVKIKKGYRERMSKDYKASFHLLSSDPVFSQQQINLWVEEKTEGMIPNFLPYPLNPNVKFAAFNAAYFEGGWRSRFYEGATHLSTFFSDKGEVETEMMCNNIWADYYEEKEFQAVDLTYAGNIFRMRIILPCEGYALEQIVDLLTLNIPAMECKGGMLNLTLPKFKVRHRQNNLENLLKRTGIVGMFENPKCFYPISRYKGLMRDIELNQETLVECCERGTKATAVTGMAPAMFSGERFEIPEIRIDRPFIFLILEKKSGAIMFAGVVRDPTK